MLLEADVRVEEAPRNGRRKFVLRWRGGCVVVSSRAHLEPPQGEPTYRTLKAATEIPKPSTLNQMPFPRALTSP